MQYNVTSDSLNHYYANHVRAADIDNDGFDDVIVSSITLNDNNKIA